MTAPGFFGKVRSHGDFVGRRLPPSFRQPWDDWLQAGLLQSRHDLGAAWLPAWIEGAIWRFSLAPGVCGDSAWSGVMMPGVDQVGRYFPLTIAAPLATLPGDVDAWFITLEDLALGSLEDNFDIERFDAALAALTVPQAGTVETGMSLWWTDGGGRLASCTAACAGLPTPVQFTALLDGRWQERGWRG